MKKTLIVVLLAGALLCRASAQTTNLSQVSDQLGQASKSLNELAADQRPASLPESLSVEVDYGAAPQQLLAQDAYKQLDSAALTNITSSRTGHATVTLVFLHPKAGILSLGAIRASLDSQGLRPAEPLELLAFAHQYTNRIGRFWLDVPIAPPEPNAGMFAALTVINDGEQRELRYFPCAGTLPDAWYRIACVRK